MSIVKYEWKYVDTDASFSYDTEKNRPEAISAPGCGNGAFDWYTIASAMMRELIGYQNETKSKVNSVLLETAEKWCDHKIISHVQLDAIKKLAEHTSNVFAIEPYQIDTETAYGSAFPYMSLLYRQCGSNACVKVMVGLQGIRVCSNGYIRCYTHEENWIMSFMKTVGLV